MAKKRKCVGCHCQFKPQYDSFVLCPHCYQATPEQRAIWRQRKDAADLERKAYWAMRNGVPSPTVSQMDKDYYNRVGQENT